MEQQEKTSFNPREKYCQEVLFPKKQRYLVNSKISVHNNKYTTVLRRWLRSSLISLLCNAF